MKIWLTVLVFLISSHVILAQIALGDLGDGIQLLGKDSMYFAKVGFRIQNLYKGDWVLDGGLDHDKSSFLIRRTRLKFSGWAYSPKITYKLEMGFSNFDTSGAGELENKGADNTILDAYVEWKFYKNFSVLFGQTKLPGNRERVISSANMQFVDRSILNSRFNIDRDLGVHLNHQIKINDVIIKKTFALSQGEGRNITIGYFDAFNYTFHVEFLPFGSFAEKGDFRGGAIVKEATHKLAIGLTYNHNEKAVRTLGQRGAFIIDSDGNYHGKPLQSIFVDLMYKYKAFSVMAEFASTKTYGELPFIELENEGIIGSYYTGNGLNLQLGYLLDSNWEIAFRYAFAHPESVLAANENNYTIGLSKYVIGQALKIQSDLTFKQIEDEPTAMTWRFQVDFAF